MIKHWMETFFLVNIQDHPKIGDTLWQLNIAIENDHSLFTHFG